MIVSVDGNAGVGKSTVVESFSDLFATFPARGVDLLTKYIEDPLEYGLPLSLRILHDLYLIGRAPGDVKIVEGNPQTARHVYTQLMYNDGTLSHAGYELYKKYHDALAWTPDAIVYIESTAATDHQKRVEFQFNNYLKYAGCPVYRVTSVQEAKDVVLQLIRC